MQQVMECTLICFSFFSEIHIEFTFVINNYCLGTAINFQRHSVTKLF